MDNPFDDLAKLVGKVLAKRWLSRNTSADKTTSDGGPINHRSSESPTKRSVVESANTATTDSDFDEGHFNETRQP
ncbi:MAG: hypothetical protein DWQ35_13775 [Planctomycetota bacterium]|nr:MAG: hypothetical protein DWQ35_13775 [Planctomycetota bacterium]REK25989.1 MAG: hypothetical protein DWQ42_10185 [Planctomycetota bacterium]REK46896.1 MAG: hypothetical protein DWQ46_05220 [Planctomycetota bacterium]